MSMVMYNITDSTDIANAFNSHYTSVANKFLKKCKYNGNKSYQSYLKNQFIFVYDETKLSSWNWKYYHLNWHWESYWTKQYTPKDNQINIEVNFSTPFKLIQHVLFWRLIFKFLRISSAIPIYKKDRKLTVANYRLLSLFSNINKIVEKLNFQ